MTSHRTEEEPVPMQPQDVQSDESAPDTTGAQERDVADRESRAEGGEASTGEGPQDNRDATAAGNAELQELRDRYLRLAAEFDNYRKRTERERAEHSARAQGKLVAGMLDAIDDLERVADFTTETTTVAALLEGVQMVERKILRALEAAGLEPVDARGAPFDPEHHEALMTAQTEHPHEDETVGEVFQKGYRFQGHLLRPARVQVRKHDG